MKTFKKGNWLKPEIVCPICKTQKDGEIILVPIVGTQDGKNIEAKQTHTDCIQERLMYYPENYIMALNCNIQ